MRGKTVLGFLGVVWKCGQVQHFNVNWFSLPPLSRQWLAQAPRRCQPRHPPRRLRQRPRLAELQAALAERQALQLHRRCLALRLRLLRWQRRWLLSCCCQLRVQLQAQWCHRLQPEAAHQQTHRHHLPAQKPPAEAPPLPLHRLRCSALLLGAGPRQLPALQAALPPCQAAGWEWR